MTPQDPAAQLCGWIASKAVEAIVSRAVQPIATRAGKALLQRGSQLIVRNATARIGSVRRRT